MFAKDWTLKSDEELALIASAAFTLGLEDGRSLSAPIDSYAVLARLQRLGVKAGGDMLKAHRIKMRQVYGAGFDISKAVIGFTASHDGGYALAWPLAGASGDLDGSTPPKASTANSARCGSEP